MACNELGALRLGLMKVLGIENEAARIHDENEVGASLTSDGPIKSLANSQNLYELKSFYQNSLVNLDNRIGELGSDHKELAYYNSLMILTKKVELELENQITSIEKLYQNIDEVHDFVHEIYPGN